MSARKFYDEFSEEKEFADVIINAEEINFVFAFRPDE